VAKTPADYQTWVNAMKAANGKYVSPYDGSPEDNGSPVIFSATNYNSVMAAPVAAAPAAAPAAPAAAPAAKTAAAPAAPSWDMATAMAKGKQVYDQNCASCHMPDGNGNPELGAKPIAGSPIANGPLKDHIERVLKGKGIMPAWGNMLNDTDLAAVITFERNAFGNHMGDLVKPEDIKAAK
jgi:mono/diheme cytochrome c family protein